MIEILLSFPAFQMVAENDYNDFIELTKTLHMENFELDKVIFKQGDEPENAYVIVFGECEVKVSFSFMKLGSVRHKTKTMCKLETKSLFGELSLLFKGKRTATISANDFCSMLVIPNAAFRRYMKTLLLRKLSVTINFYRSLSFMDNLPTNVILILASKTELQRFSKDTLICMQGNKSSNVYFIKYGRVRILRTIDFTVPDKDPTIHNYKNLYNEPTPELRQLGQVN